MSQRPAAAEKRDEVSAAAENRDEVSLEQTGDHAVLGDVDALGSRHLGQTGHSDDVTRKGHDEARAGIQTHLTDKEYWVLAMHTGAFAQPSASKLASCLRVLPAKTTSFAP